MADSSKISEHNTVDVSMHIFNRLSQLNRRQKLVIPTKEILNFRSNPAAMNPRHLKKKLIFTGTNRKATATQLLDATMNRQSNKTTNSATDTLQKLTSFSKAVESPLINYKLTYGAPNVLNSSVTPPQIVNETVPQISEEYDGESSNGEVFQYDFLTSASPFATNDTSLKKNVGSRYSSVIPSIFHSDTTSEHFLSLNSSYQMLKPLHSTEIKTHDQSNCLRCMCTTFEKAIETLKVNEATRGKSKGKSKSQTDMLEYNPLYDVLPFQLSKLEAAMVKSTCETLTWDEFDKVSVLEKSSAVNNVDPLKTESNYEEGFIPSHLENLLFRNETVTFLNGQQAINVDYDPFIVTEVSGKGSENIYLVDKGDDDTNVDENMQGQEDPLLIEVHTDNDAEEIKTDPLNGDEETCSLGSDYIEDFDFFPDDTEMTEDFEEMLNTETSCTSESSIFGVNNDYAKLLKEKLDNLNINPKRSVSADEEVTVTLNPVSDSTINTVENLSILPREKKKYSLRVKPASNLVSKEIASAPLQPNNYLSTLSSPSTSVYCTTLSPVTTPALVDSLGESYTLKNNIFQTSMVHSYGHENSSEMSNFSSRTELPIKNSVSILRVNDSRTRSYSSKKMKSIRRPHYPIEKTDISLISQPVKLTNDYDETFLAKLSTLTIPNEICPLNLSGNFSTVPSQAIIHPNDRNSVISKMGNNGSHQILRINNNPLVSGLVNKSSNVPLIVNTSTFTPLCSYMENSDTISAQQAANFEGVINRVSQHALTSQSNSYHIKNPLDLSFKKDVTQISNPNFEIFPQISAVSLPYANAVNTSLSNTVTNQFTPATQYVNNPLNTIYTAVEETVTKRICQVGAATAAPLQRSDFVNFDSEDYTLPVIQNSFSVNSFDDPDDAIIL